MIEPTDEMVAAFAAAKAAVKGCPGLDDGDEQGLAAVLAIVERDREPVTEYTICALPEDDINHGSFAVKVAYRGRGLWAVVRHRYCLGRDGEWDYESMPSGRTDEWLAEHRFTEAEALRLAREAAPHIRVNGMTAAEVQAWAASRRTPTP
ncbi:MAG TPA: hypothetical protein VOB72_08220 [Candidatus Dormibacteraeota bacterium]|nr:hypothetical protein [Candidatus Dormibacteraeota bacterium]